LNLVFDLIHHTNPALIYLLVAVILLLESSGIPIVNSTLLLLTGALASLGRLNIFALVIASITGSILGACLAYVIGWYGGGQLLLRAASRLHIDTQKIQGVERWFQNTGARMIFFARIIPYIRPFACFPAGIARMPFRRFFAAASIGSVIWCAGVLTIGWMLGRHWRLAFNLIETYTLPAVLVIVVAAVLNFLLKLAIRRRLHARLQATTGDVVDVEGQNDCDLLEV